ncbi:MAG: ribonuclease P protein component [Pseudomonadota bacterium]
MTRLRFRPSQRILDAAAFKFVFKNARRSRDTYFTVLSAGASQPHARLGLAVSRKTDKRAVVRNRIKRTVRESFRTQSLPAQDFVVISQPKAASASANQLRSSLATHWQRLDKRT